MLSLAFTVILTHWTTTQSSMSASIHPSDRQGQIEWVWMCFAQWTRAQREVFLRRVLDRVVPGELDDLTFLLDRTMRLPDEGASYSTTMQCDDQGELLSSSAFVDQQQQQQQQQQDVALAWLDRWSDTERNAMLNGLSEIDIHMMNEFQDWVRRLRWR
ncbi:hypothetical protein CAOG_02615 [Capsaspora owczarzaki ATCC 30864]|uniref:hypothetical protein n=1 Tax=Capsaspora owczarzaki (strain ATCC 30864) TaxID=595528 RepID=UPI0001FE2E35|nr:hypothetical protein CAOG_02615 [Capsaspora owczarzaki ATCC 30864]|eukprot:XP_004349365.1 hypothetical protein CAOG_02615 [Capsaspora owczarzaki ATCC 30864]